MEIVECSNVCLTVRSLTLVMLCFMFKVSFCRVLLPCSRAAVVPVNLHLSTMTGYNKIWMTFNTDFKVNVTSNTTGVLLNPLMHRLV